MHFSKKISALLLVLTLSVSIFAGCSDREPAASEESSSSSSTSSSSTSEPEETGEPVSSITPDFSELITEAHEQNEDSIGWLQVPGTGIEDVVLFKPDDKTNEFYLRLDFNKNYSFNGVYYADMRSTFGDGSRNELGMNTCIYGHAITDDPESEKYDIKFGPLHDFRDPDLAKNMPYLFFSTEKENMAFEVFAVFVSNADNLSVPYNRNDVPQEEFVEMVREEILPRSKYDYDVEIQDDDKFLTLSTCIYTLDNGVQTGYPNTFYRLGIMGRLVDPDEPLKEEAVFTENEDVIIDATGGKWDNTEYLAKQAEKEAA